MKKIIKLAAIGAAAALVWKKLKKETLPEFEGIYTIDEDTTLSIINDEGQCKFMISGPEDQVYVGECILEDKFATLLKQSGKVYGAVVYSKGDFIYVKAGKEPCTIKKEGSLVFEG